MYSWGEVALTVALSCLVTMLVVMKLTVWLAGPLGCV